MDRKWKDTNSKIQCNWRKIYIIEWKKLYEKEENLLYQAYAFPYNQCMHHFFDYGLMTP